MYRLHLLFRLISMIFLLSLPFGLLGALFFGITGVLGGLLLTLLGVVGVAKRAESIIVRAHAVKAEDLSGLKQSLQAVTLGWAGQLPQLKIFEDPFPNLLVVRSLGGPGTVLLSRGMISLLNEEELESILQICVEKTQEPGIVFRTLCLILAVWTLSLAPRSWVNLVFAARTLSELEERKLSPLSAVGFLLLFPFAQFFLRSSRAFSSENAKGRSERSYCNAVQKINQSACLRGSVSKNENEMGSLYLLNSCELII